MAVARARSGAYIWVTWLAPLLADEAFCRWSAWFKAHFFHEKARSFNAIQWQAEHTRMVSEARDAHTVDGFTVREEDANRFALTNGGITLAGKPDLVAVDGSKVLIIDCKSGCPHEAHRAQVLIYMAVLPCVRPELKDLELEGVVRYKDDEIRIPALALDDEFRARLRSTIHLVGGSTPPPRTPSERECQFCTIGSWDCSDRIEPVQVQPTTEHDLF